MLLDSCSPQEHSTYLLELLPVSKTQVDFSNRIVEDDSFNILNFMYLYNGAGLGVADLNNDGLADLFFAGNQVMNRLYLNRGKFEFSEVSKEAGIMDVAWCTGVSMVDINQDGWMDIYVSVAHPIPHHEAPNLLYLNQGTNDRGIPVFLEVAEKIGLADEGYSTHAAFFDYDQDGDLDLYLLTNALGQTNIRNTPRIDGPIKDGTAQNSDRLYRNNGMDSSSFLPTYSNVSKEAGIVYEGWGLGVAIADINQDGWPDIYVANDFLSNDLLYINQGFSRDQGQVIFKNQIDHYLKHQSHNGMGVDVADINNDALIDIIELDMMPDDNLRQKSMFAAINNDAWHMNRSLGYQAQYVRNTLQLNNGNGSFSDIGQLSGVSDTDWSWAPLLIDMDNDGWRDLIISNGYHRDVSDLDFMNYRNDASMFGSDEEKNRKRYEILMNMTGIKESNYVFRNNGDLTFTDKSDRWGFTTPSYSNGVVYADFDKDGDLDLAFNNLNDSAFIYQNTLQEKPHDDQGTKHFFRLKLRSHPPNRDAIGAKVSLVYQDTGNNWCRQFQENYPYRGYKSAVESILHFGLAVESIDSLVVRWPNGAVQVVTDIPVNQVYELTQKGPKDMSSWPNSVVPNPFLRAIDIEGLSHMHKETPFPDFNYWPLKHVKHSQNGPGMAVGDIDGNKLDDLYIGGSKGNAGRWFLQRDDGRFIPDSMQMDRRHEDMGCLLFDADQDGDLDLYVASGGSEVHTNSDYYQDRLYLNDGEGHWARTENALPIMYTSTSCVSAYDFDHDGDLDLFVGGRFDPENYPHAPRSYLLENRDGKFLDVTDQKADGLQYIGMVTSALWTDFDMDGWRDLIVVGEWMPITLYKNDHTGGFIRFQSNELDQAHGWWNSIASGDFDHDGDLDYIVGNEGLNHRFEASVQEPISMYAKDYDENGTVDPVLFHYLEGKSYPYHPRDVLAKQIVAMHRRFPLYADYGRASIDEVFTKAELEKAYKLSVTQLASCYLENLGLGNFRLSALPIQAQIAPIFGIDVKDFDADGNLDAFLIGNSQAPDVHLGSSDASGGLLILGDGRGNFIVPSANAQGVWIDCDGKSLVSIQTVSSGPCLVAACNQGPLTTFSSSSSFTDRSILSIPSDAILLEMEDEIGRQWVLETNLGSGYLSQSSNDLVVGAKIVRILSKDFQGHESILYQKSADK